MSAAGNFEQDIRASSRDIPHVRRQSWTVYSGIILVVAALVSAVAIYVGDLRQIQINRLADVQASSRQLHSLLLDAETGQRGFLLTGSDRFIEPYTRAKAAFPAVMQHVERELAGNPEFAGVIGSIRRLQTEKAEEMDQTIQLYRDNRPAEALALVSSEVGRMIMETMRADFARIDQQINADIAQISQARAGWNALLWGACISALGISLLLAWWQLVRTRRTLVTSLLARSQLEQSERALQSEVSAKAGEARQLSSLLAAIADSTPDAVYAKDLEGRLIFANKACLAVLGKSPDEALGATPLELSANDAEANVIAAVDRAVIETGDAVEAEENYTTDGNRRIYLSRKAPLRGAGGRITGLVGLSTDITKRKRDEAALFESDQRFKAAVRAVHGVLWTNSAEGEMVGEQPAWAELTGQSREEYAGYGWSTAVHPDDAQPTIDAWKLAVAEKRPFEFEHRVRRHDGEWRLFEIRSVPIINETGQITEWVGVHLDITDEREVQKRLATALEQLRMALDASQTGTWEINLNTGESLWDERLFSIWGMEGPEAPSLDETMALLHEEDRVPALEQFETFKTINADAVLDVEFRITRASDKEERWLVARGRVFKSDQGVAVLRGTTRDITDRKRREAQIRFLMGELTHRTKNIMAIIQSIVRQTARNATNVAQFSDEFSQRLTGVAGSLDLLIKDNWQGASLIELVSIQSAPIVGSANGRLRLHGNDIRLRSDAAQNLGLALHELSTNAVKYGALSTPSGFVDLSWRISKTEDGGQVFELIWKENGGPPVVQPTRKGFGHVVMDRLVKASLAGSADLAFEPDGVRWTLRVPTDNLMQS